MSVVPPIIILELQKKKVSSMAIIIPVRSAKTNPNMRLENLFSLKRAQS